MSDVIGRGILETVVDSTQLKAGIAESVDAVKKFEKAAGDAGKNAGDGLAKVADGADKAATSTKNLDAQTKRYFTSLEREADAAGKTRSEFLALRASKLGVTEAAGPLIARIAAAEKATTGLGMSAKATAAAMRNVPAQFTDIVVSLQAGQAPLTVLLQQGGQLKDMFGGIGAAAKALGTYLLGLITPVTVIVGAIVGLAAVYAKGASESAGFNKAIISTGNYAGVTKDQLLTLSKNMSGLGVTQGAASEALQKLVETGKVAGNQLGLVATAALNLSKITGQDLTKSIEDFAKLGEEPVKASEKLNEQYHYLTQATFEQIRALDELGKHDEAAALAQKSLADATNQRFAEVKAGQGTLERGWDSLAGAAKRAWDAMLNVGRPDTFQQKIDEQQAKIAAMQGQAAAPQRQRRFGEQDQASIASEQETARLMKRSQTAQQETAQQQARRAADEQNAIAVTKNIKQLQDQAKGVSAVTRELEKYHKELDLIRKVNPGSELLTDSAIAAGEQAIRKKYMGSVARVKPFQDDAGTKYLLTLQQTQAKLEESLETDMKLTDSMKERVKFEQLISDLKTKGTLTADQKSLLAAKDQILAQLDKNVAIEDEVKAREKVRKAAELQAAADARAYETFVKRQESINLSIASNQEGRDNQSQRQLEVFGLGDKARQQVEAQRQIYDEFKKYKLELDKSTPAELLGGDEYNEQADKIQAGLEKALASQKNYYDQLTKMQGDWSYGANAALQNYIDGVKNVSAEAGKIFGNFFKDLEDQLTDAASGGKFSFKKIFDGLQKDIVRAGIRKDITGPLAEYVQGALGSDSDSGIGGAIGGYFKTLFGGGGDAFNKSGTSKGLPNTAAGATTALSSFTKAVMAATNALGGKSVNGAAGSFGDSLGRGFSSLFGSGASQSGFFTSLLGSSGQASFSQTSLGSSGFGTGLAYGNQDLATGLAIGGVAGAGRRYEVTENGPEMLSMQNGRNFLLMPGNQAGNVTPVNNSGSERTLQVTNNFILSQPASKQTQTQVAASAQQGLRRGARNM